jgi:DNA-binding CsgD family transcriptional regulator
VSEQAERGRDAFARQAWGEAYDLLVAADELPGDDLELVAVSAHLLGRDDESGRAWEEAYRQHVAVGEAGKAARCGAWLGIGCLLRGDIAHASGWLARAGRLLDDAGIDDCAARGYLGIPDFLHALGRGDVDEAGRLADECVAIGERFADADLIALGILGQGQVAVAVGEIAAGMRFLDEAMVAVTAGEVSPIPAGIVYCAVVAECMEAFDLRRAAEWTEALSQWCAAQPGLVPYRGQCLVHRSQVLQAHGAWREAVIEADRARAHLSQPVHPALGMALYQWGELHRLRGRHADAEQAYRAAHDGGYEPAPGLALLRLAEGHAALAAATVRRMLDERREPLRRAPVLAAAVEIMVAAHDRATADAAAGELERIAATMGAPLLEAIAADARGTILLAEGHPSPALDALRRAHGIWHLAEMPFEAARTRVAIGQCCRALGDEDTARLELGAALATFDRLGARTERRRVELLAGPSSDRAVLTDREREVLRLVADGRSDRQIAADLVISEHTVGRHLQNIFRKLEVTSRAAATAYAYQHGRT